MVVTRMMPLFSSSVPTSFQDIFVIVIIFHDRTGEGSHRWLRLILLGRQRLFFLLLLRRIGKRLRYRMGRLLLRPGYKVGPQDIR